MKQTLKHIIYLTLFLTISLGCSAAQQQYKSHIVKKGETVYSISKQYGITEAAILKLNPDAKDGVRENAVIILPSSDVINVTSQELRFTEHKAKRKETLYGIAKQYGVSEDDIKKYNKFLYSEQLRRGDKLKIPVELPVKTITTTTTNNTTVTNTTTDVSTPTTGGVRPVPSTHTVQPKETVYGIARMYGITMDELKRSNPGLTNDLPMGTVLNVPSDKATGTATIDESQFMLYEVKPKEGFFRLEQTLNITEDEIIALNPYAKDGLKEGMILKIPRSGTSVEMTDWNTKKDLENFIVNRSEKRIAVLLPFQMNRIQADSTNAQEAALKGNSAMRVSLDFYSGVLMATEFAKDKGISTRLDVFDTQGSESTVRSLIENNNVNNVDAVIGPLLSKNVKQAVSSLKSSNTPVFSPLSNREIKLSTNLFQTLPSNAQLEQSMIDYLVKNGEGKNIVLISDKKHLDKEQLLLSKFPNAKIVQLKEEGYIYNVHMQEQIDATLENWVILNSADPAIVSNAVALLNGMPLTKRIRLFTLDKNDAYEYNDVSNANLAKLQFTFPSVNKAYNYNDKQAFLISYKNKYGVSPNRYAVRGFDVTYDVLLRLASDEDVYKASDSDYETEYIENKFRYTKKMFAGYQNTASYILKYTEKLQFEVVR